MPCRRPDSAFKCECGLTYSHRSSLYRHKSTCLVVAKNKAGAPDAQPVSVARISQKARTIQNTIQNIITIAPVTTTNILALGSFPSSEAQRDEGSSAAAKIPGWPAKWPPLAEPPRSFSAPNLTIPFGILQRALAASAGRGEACRRGEPAAIAALLVEIVRLAHADPRERNMYPNPNRADQVLVYIPERWETLSLQEGISLALTRAMDGLAAKLPLMAPPLQNLAQAAHAGFHAKKSEVMKSSRGAMAAHLENLAALARDRVQRHGEAGDSWLGDLSGLQEVEPRVLGEEHINHLPVAALAAALELALGIYCEDDLAARAAGLHTLAQRALTVFGRMLLAGRPDNLAIIVAGDGATYVNTIWGWRPKPAAEAAYTQARAYADLLFRYLGMPDALVFAPLSAYVEKNLETLAEEESRSLGLLTQYARAAEKYYSSSEGRKLEEPRRLLLGKLQDNRTPRSLPPPHSGRALVAAPSGFALGPVEEPTSRGAQHHSCLPDADLDELLAELGL